MIIDSQNEFSVEQAVTTSAASENYINNGSVDLGMADVSVALTVKEAVAAAGAATVNFKIEMSDQSDFSGAVTALESGAIAKADLIKGFQKFFKLPVGTNKKYVRAYYEVATGPLTAGKFHAAIVGGVQANVAYPNAI